MYSIDYIDTINKPMVALMMENYQMKCDRLTTDCYSNVKIDYKGNLYKNCECENISLKAIYLGHFLSIWGHCITDNLRKFWFLLTPEYQKLKASGFVLVCTIQDNKKITKNFRELISFLGLSADDIRIVESMSTFKEMVIPQDSLDQDHHFYPEFKNTIDFLISRIPHVASSAEKIYFSRTHLKKNWRDYGEYLIENAFQKLGYSIVYPERLSFKEQVQLLQNCGSFAATDGSIAHNAIFCRDGIECIVISKKVGITAYQYSIMNMRDFSSIFIDAHLSIFRIFATWFGPFFMYANDNLVRFCKDRGLIIKWQFPVSLFLRYCLSCLFLFVRYRLSVSFVPEVRYYCDVLKHNIKRKILFDR